MSDSDIAEMINSFKGLFNNCEENNFEEFSKVINSVCN